jgi:hypothetical protein
VYTPLVRSYLNPVLSIDSLTFTPARKEDHAKHESLMETLFECLGELWGNMTDEERSHLRNAEQVKEDLK